jgi:hypothetical protein
MKRLSAALGVPWRAYVVPVLRLLLQMAKEIGISASSVQRIGMRTGCSRTGQRAALQLLAE